MQVRVSCLLKLSLLFVTALWVSGTYATVLYKKVDKDGKVTFSDKPSDDAEKITIKSDKNSASGSSPINSMTPKAIDDSSEQDELSVGQDPYKIFAIDSPTNNEAIQVNNGILNIIIGITPQLDPAQSIRLHLNGQTVGRDQKLPYFSLTNVKSGTHEILAVIINDETGEIVQTSSPVTFHLIQ